MKHMLHFARALILLFAIDLHADQLRSLDDVGDVFMPGPKVVGVTDAWTLYNNPSGIAFVDGAQFVGGYGYRISDADIGRHQAKGSLALNIIDGFSVALGLHLSLPQIQAGDDQGLIGGSLAAAYRFGRAFSVGARMTRQRQYKNSASDPFLFGLGFETFPTSWLSLGTSVSQVYDDILGKPEIRAGIAVRPFGEAFTLSGETLFWPNDETLNTNFAIYPEIGARLDLGGFSLLASARASDVTQGFSAPTIFAGIEFNFEHFGIGILAQGRPNDRLSVGGRFRVSSETWPTLAPKRERIVSINLDSDAIATNEPLSLKRRLFGPGQHHIETLASLDALASDDTVSGVSLRFSPFAFNFPRADEIRRAILKLREADKKVYVHFDSASAATYLAASAADAIYMSPAGEIDVDDFRNSLAYFRNTLDKFGINVQAVTAGKHKNAPDTLTRASPSPEELEVRNDILNQQLAAFQSATSVSKDTLDLGVLTAQEAKARGLILDLKYADEVFVPAQAPRNVKKKHWGNPSRIAAIPVKGMIVPGKSAPTLLKPFGSTAAAQDIIAHIEKAANDSSVSAIVLRIDTPGGDALASNLLHHAVLRARTKKPVVATMGDMATSGGYYLASACNFIFAHPTTLTGSIGVFSLHFSAGDLAARIGVTQYELKRGRNPGGTLLRGLSASELARKQSAVDKAYEVFKKAIADARHLSLEAVEKAADGRVWTASQALKLGLVDEMGGFADAVKKAQTLAQVSDPIEVQLVGVDAPPLVAMPRLVNSLVDFADTHLPLAHSPLALSTLLFNKELP